MPAGSDRTAPFPCTSTVREMPGVEPEEEEEEDDDGDDESPGLAIEESSPLHAATTTTDAKRKALRFDAIGSLMP